MAKITRKPSDSKHSSRKTERESSKKSVLLTNRPNLDYDTSHFSANSLRRSVSKLADTYRSTAVEHFTRLSREVEEDGNVDDSTKVTTLLAAIRSISQTLNRITQPAPGVAPELFENRPSKSENAFEFTQRVYGKYIERGLSKHDIRSLDYKLYQAILDRERRHDDKSLVLLRHKEANDKLLAQFGGVISLANITDALPGIFRERLRLYRTASVRKHRRQKGFEK